MENEFDNLLVQENVKIEHACSLRSLNACSLRSQSIVLQLQEYMVALTIQSRLT